MLLGRLTCTTSVVLVIGRCSFLPLAGVFALLPPRELKLLRNSDAARSEA